MAKIDHSHWQHSTAPKVSILLPNLNTRSFLEERIKTILDQSLTDWELIIVDSYSDDGSWEYFQECAKMDTRIRASQAPREGIYAGWNRCIRLSRGEYVYIATSDDTMTSDCIEKMVAALENHPDCGIAICCFRTIDDKGNEIDGTWERYGGNQALGEWLKVVHTRYPPFDTIINCAWDTTYISITQLLIRKSALDRIGLFRTDFGSWGDYEWNIRNSLLTPRVHVPEFLATWRRIPGQHTQDTVFSTAKWHRKAVEMIRCAYHTARDIDPSSVRSISLHDLLLPQIQEVVKATVRDCTDVPQKCFNLLAVFFEFPYATFTYVLRNIAYNHSAFGLGPQHVKKLLIKITYWNNKSELMSLIR